ncbi:MAG TPA: hypothetical protein VEQ37_04110 [Actinomycetota bacterium]|nr:hypothetical protein [Actinomycetota bacterium]
MVARPTLDSVVSLVWIGGLALVLLVRAMFVWVRFRYATRSARHARRLADATQPVTTRATERPVTNIVAFRKRTPTLPAGPEA